MGLFFKDLPNSATLTSDTYSAVSVSGDTKTYKTTMGDIKEFTNKTPLILQDEYAYNVGEGNISVSKGSNTLVFSDSVDYNLIDIGDIIRIVDADSNTSTFIVTAIPGYPNITATPSSMHTYTNNIFSYIKPTLVTKKNTGDISGSMSSFGYSLEGSLTADGSVSASQSGAFSKTYTDSIRPLDGSTYMEINSNNGTNIAVRCIDDCMHKTPHKPSFRANMSANQGVAIGQYTKINFNIINGSDTSNTTHNRNPVGWSGFDTTNRSYAVPYGTGYDQEAYLAACHVHLNPIQLGNPGTVSVSLVGTSTATSTFASGTIIMQTFEYRFPVTPGFSYQMSIKMSGTVLLNPATYANHRYLSLWLWHNGTVCTIDSTNYLSWFSVSCLG